MKIKFNLNYHTNWGEWLYICGSLPELGSNDALKAVEMKQGAPDNWYFELELPTGSEREFTYFFVVKAPDREWRFEWGEPHRLHVTPQLKVINVTDEWNAEPHDKPYFSSAFVDGMLKRVSTDAPLNPEPDSLNLRIEAPMVLPNEVLAVCGSSETLGAWDPARALKMNDARYPLWEVNIPLTDNTPFDYKFLIVDKESGEVHAWENRDNRWFGQHRTHSGEQIVIDALRFVNPRDNWKGAGTAIPVFSIRSTEDEGVGDFYDIRLMVDWCRKTGQKVLQILPINDTTKTGTWVDSYPYSANSTFALHPMYIRMSAVGELKDKARAEYYKLEAAKLNELPQIDYERVNDLKNEFLHEIYKQDGEKLFKTPEFKEFKEKNDYWLRPYAVWCALRDEFHTPDNSQWRQLSTFDQRSVDEYCTVNAQTVNYFYFVQYHLDRQLREVRDYAHANEVVLKGDVPIGIGRFSADAWQHTRLFNMNCQAGAPPDDFSVLGQNWGFPTYNWDEMAKDGFAWWKDRFRKMAEYCDAYRIDHILGFFRIWQIPLDAVHGLLGYFNPALPFSPEELRNSYDFWINPEVQCRPLVLEWMLGDFFGEYAQEVKADYLRHVGGDRFELAPEFDTQAKVVAHFDKLERNPKNDRIRDGLLGLIDDVLFIEDPYQKGHYHPRISAQFTYQFRVLTDYEKWCFNRLYNDFFYHRHNDFWYGKAMWKLPPLLDATKMLACGEDLGMIPDCVPEVMRKLQILSLEIQRMPKDPKSEFGDTWHYPYFSVCTTSTHDMPGVRAWWESDKEQSQRFFNNVLGEHGEAPFFAEPWICDKIVWAHLASPSMLCILPLQDWLSTDGELRRENPNDEQINEPSNPTHYWRYRMHLTAEKLLSEDLFNNKIHNSILASGR